MYKKVLKSTVTKKVQIKTTTRYYYTLIRMATIEEISSVQSLGRVRLFATPWTAACQASLSITDSRSLFKLMSIEPVMPSNHLILCCPLFFQPSIFPSISVFSNESALRIRCQSIGVSASNSFNYMHLCQQSDVCSLMCCLGWS